MSSQPSRPFGRQTDYANRPADYTATQPDFPEPPHEIAPAPPWSPVPLLLAILVLVLGALLGVANQDASRTSMTLRVPALLAALLMVGQGAVASKRTLPARQRRTVSHSRTVDQRGQAVREAPRATVTEINQRAVPAAAVRPTAATLSVPISVMILSAWLGLADLTVDDAPAMLSVLSLIAAFTLVALAWSLLPARR